MSDEILNSIPMDRVMAKSNITTIQQLQGGQFIANFPKAIVEAFGWKKGDQLEWTITQNGVLVKKHESSDLRES